MSFTHLQVRSGYSFLDSTNTIEKLVEKAHELEFTALALTDEEVLYGTIPFYKTCLTYGIKPLIGMSINVIMTPEETEQCVVLAKNNNGYQQLIKISSKIQESNEAGISFETFSAHTNDLICIIPVHTSKLSGLLNQRSHDEASMYIEKWQELFSHVDFYLGIQPFGETNDDRKYQTVKAFHETTKIPVVAINDVRYLEEQDYLAYDCLQAIKHDQSWEGQESNQMLKQRHLTSSDEMHDSFASFWPEVLQETEAIQARCHVSFDLQTKHMPSFPVPNGQEAHTYLRDLCEQKLPERFSQVTKEVEERLSYELHVIQSMTFSDYFLIVADYIDYARKNNILVGPGRGSAAGSIVAYVLGITDINPLEYNLLFERFLNPGRATMPDIDVDFSDHRRDEVIDYVRKKYGEDHVAQIITFGTFGARSLLRELFKTMEVDQRDAAFILSKIPTHTDQPITAYVKETPDLIDYIKQSPKLRLLFTVAAKLEGLPRHLSTHAAGVVISERPLIDYVPLTRGANGNHLTQFPMNDLEAVGLLKMDFLGLRNLTLLERIVRSIRYSVNKQFSIHHLPREDIKTFELLQKGKTNGVFQLESVGMKRVLTQLKPTSFEDIVAVNALYRPGPMDYISTYIGRKHEQEQTTYLHPDMKPILKQTYGVLIYQEQIMQLAYKMAGFTFGEADILRRAISKKESTLLSEQQVAFIQGCMNNGYDQATATELFSWIVKFSNYGFNRSHAVAYSKISYQLAYLKANYPLNFYAELLSDAGNQTEKMNQHFKEAQDLNITILPPSINKSYGKYAVENNAVRMGLLSIKGIGHHVVQEIITQRKNRPFTDLFDFCMRVSLKIINRKTMEILIIAGVFDEIYTNRASLLASIDQALDQGELFGGLNSQPSLLPDKYGIEERYTEVDDFSQVKKLADEKELLGVYLSSHPLKTYRKRLLVNGYVPFNETPKLLGKHNIRSAAIVHAIKKIRTKRGDPMAFITIGDEYSDMEAVLFPTLYRQEHRWLEEEMMVFISGKIEERNDRIQWLLSTIEPFDEHKLTISEQRLFIKLTEADHRQALLNIKEVAKQHPGSTSVIIYDQTSNRTYQLAKAYQLEASEHCLHLLSDFFGETNVVLER